MKSLLRSALCALILVAFTPLTSDFSVNDADAQNRRGNRANQADGANVNAEAGEETVALPAWEWDENDPRIGLSPGVHDAGEAIRNLNHLSNLPRPDNFTAVEASGGGRASNTDLAFKDEFVFVGSYHGFNAYDVSDPNNPELAVSVVCPGGQGDVSVHENLLFMSVQESRGRLDCGIGGVEERISESRLRGIRIFDISDVRLPRQVGAVQTCRGSHTHSLVSDLNDPDNVYVYVSGTSPVRPADELEGCVEARDPEEDPNTSYFRIEVIKVPLAAPQNSEVVNMPRIFADDEGNIAGLWEGGDHGPGTQRSRRTTQCHDITAYPALGLAGGACAGNGILLDITDPANPVRVDEVTDPNFAYWHSATFNNDGSTVLFTDEWGGGNAPRCLGTDLPTWGANAIFKLKNNKMTLAGYYKLPVPQTEHENCVAHNGSLIPVPGRDIKAQAWYQGGMSVFDFTDPANAYEIAFFDRGPISTTERVGGGYWSTYWYGGYIYGAEIVRGLDVFELTPSEHLSQNEIDAAKLVMMREFNPQNQPKFEWPAEYVVARAYVDQLERAEALTTQEATVFRAVMQQAEGGDDTSQGRLLELADALDAQALQELASGHADNSARVKVLLANLYRELVG